MLLAQLVQHAASVLGLEETPVYLWTDSMVTLGWIQGHPSKWKTYVANRVAEIQRLVPEAHWNHLPGTSNPADCASRGLLPSDLVNHELWWNGPPFLRRSDTHPTISTVMVPADCQAEERVVAMTTTRTEDPEENSLLTRVSSFHRLLRVTAWCLRWLPRGRQAELVLAKDQHQPHKGTPLSAAEINRAEKLWIRWAQTTHFARELKLISNKSKLPDKGTLTCLFPVLDEDGILRVGGRIRHAFLSIDEKHPIILPSQSNLSRLIIDACHRRSLHGGTQLTLSLIRQRFWIPRGRSMVKQH
ncbi:integrase core domain protein, partial [Lasius niger]